MLIKPPKRLAIDGDAILKEAVQRLAQPGRRDFLRRSLTLGGLSLLTGCSLSDNPSVDAALTRVSRFNDDVQAWLFDPNRLAPTYPESMITRPFPFNAYYSEDEVRHVDADSFRLEVSGLVADRHRWTLPELHAKLLGSPEVYRTAGGTNAAYVAALYPLVHGRSVDPSGAAYWAKQLDKGLRRSTLALKLLTSHESAQRTVDQAFARFLGRAADPSGRTHWTGYLEKGKDPRDLWRSLILSNEYDRKAQAA